LLSVADTHSNIPLHIAAEKGHIEPMEEILKHKDRFSLVDKNLSGKTAMHLAAENGHTE
jgi:ankyrin repeat protein